MPSYKQTSLHTLRDRRLDEERQAERALADATAAVRRAEQEAARLAARVLEARAELAAARAAPAPAERAADAQIRRRHWGSLEERVKASIAAERGHRDVTLAHAIAAREAARLDHLAARQRREVADKAIARRDAEAKREADRRAEAEADDRRKPR